MKQNDAKKILELAKFGLKIELKNMTQQSQKKFLLLSARPAALGQQHQQDQQHLLGGRRRSQGLFSGGYSVARTIPWRVRKSNCYDKLVT